MNVLPANNHILLEVDYPSKYSLKSAVTWQVGVMLSDLPHPTQSLTHATSKECLLLPENLASLDMKRIQRGK